MDNNNKPLVPTENEVKITILNEASYKNIVNFFGKPLVIYKQENIYYEIKNTDKFGSLGESRIRFRTRSQLDTNENKYHFYATCKLQTESTKIHKEGISSNVELEKEISKETYDEINLSNIGKRKILENLIKGTENENIIGKLSKFWENEIEFYNICGWKNSRMVYNYQGMHIELDHCISLTNPSVVLYEIECETEIENLEKVKSNIVKIFNEIKVDFGFICHSKMQYFLNNGITKK